jgi:hypothetical protein
VELGISDWTAGCDQGRLSSMKEEKDVSDPPEQGKSERDLFWVFIPTLRWLRMKSEVAVRGRKRTYPALFKQPRARSDSHQTWKAG